MPRERSAPPGSRCAGPRRARRAGHGPARRSRRGTRYSCSGAPRPRRYRSVSTTSTRTPRPPMPPTTVRRAVAVRPPRPITLPRSSGCTRTSSVRPRRVVTSSTCTSSGWSTMPRTRCSRASARTLTSTPCSRSSATLLTLLRSTVTSQYRSRFGGSLGGLTLGGVGLRAAVTPLLGGGGLGGGLLARGGQRRLETGLLVDLLRLRLQGALGAGQALELLPVPGDLQQVLHGLGGLSADAQPVLRPLRVDLDQARLVLRVVLADGLDRPAAAAGAGVGDDDAVVRLADLAQPHQLDLDGHAGRCSSRIVCFR